MDFRYKDLIPSKFADTSRVWIYQSSQPISSQDLPEVKKTLDEFSRQWTAHGDTVKAFAEIFFNQFIVLIADETNVTVSGCSTDSSVRLVKEIESDLKVSFFNRQLLAFIENDQVIMISLHQLDQAIKSGKINADSLYFNNTVSNKKDFLENWIIPVRSSWLAKRFEIPSVVS